MKKKVTSQKVILRKVVSVLLAVTMLVFTLAGCGSKPAGEDGGGEAKTESNAGQEADKTADAASTGEYPVIRVPYSIVFESFDAPAIQDALNEIMREKAGAEIELVGIEFGNWSTQLNLMLTGGIIPWIFSVPSGIHLSAI